MPNTSKMPLILLASGSPRRKEILSSLGLPFMIHVTNVEEAILSYCSPTDYVTQIAERKATVAHQQVLTNHSHKNSLILSADTAVVIDETILGKPNTLSEAMSMLGKLQNKTHSVFTAICLIDRQTKQKYTRALETRVTMKPLSDEMIEAYVHTGESMDKAGAYAIQGIGATLIREIMGDYFNVVGLSVSLLSDMLTEIGYPLLHS